MYKEELLNMVGSWDIAQLTDYIEQLETRITETRALIQELKSLKKRKLNKKSFENGPRDGR